MLNENTILIICGTIIILTLIVSVTYIVALKVQRQKLEKPDKEYKRMQEQCNDMYKMYLELKEGREL